MENENNNKPKKRYLTIREFVELHGEELNIKPMAIYRLIKRGALQAGTHYKAVRRDVKTSYLLKPVAVMSYFIGK